MKLVVGCDHGALDLKQEMMARLKAAGYEVEDFGCYDTKSVDYPDIAEKVCRAVVAGEYELGLLFCGTGIGMSIAANKVTGIRAALVSDSFSAKMAREHNNANILCMGARVIGSELAWDLLTAHLGSTFAGGRHQDRVDKIGRISC